MFTRADNLILFFNPLPADPQSAQPHTYPPQTLSSNDPTLSAASVVNAEVAFVHCLRQ